MNYRFKLFLSSFFIVLISWLIPSKCIAFSDDDIYVNGNAYIIDEDTKTAAWNGGVGDVIIPESFVYNGQTYTVTSIYHWALYPWHEHCPLTSVDIPSSVTSIGAYAFYDCTSLTSVTISSSEIKIGEYAFENTAWFNNQPDGLVYINDLAYSYKGKMPEGTSITIRDGTVRISDFAFSGRTGLTSVTIPSSVTSIGEEAFGSCTGLTSVTILGGGTYIGPYAFNNTAWLNNQPDGLIYINDVAYKYKGEMPEGTSISIRNGTVRISDHVFGGCTGLTSVLIPSSVTSIGDQAFYGCTGLTSVTIPSSVTSIGDQAFHGCTGLTSVTIPSSVTNIGSSAFYGCTGMTSVTIPSSVTGIGRNAFTGCISLASVTIPNSVTSICPYTFSGCKGLTSMTIPGSVASVGRSAFEGCTGLTSVSISNGVAEIGRSAFSECTGLTSVTIPTSVTKIDDHAFERCTDLTSVTIPNSVTSIGWHAFNNTPWYNNQQDGLIYINDVLYKYKGEMPEGISIAIRNGTVCISDWAFFDCTGLTSVDIPNSVTNIGDYAFDGCTGLTSVTIPSSVTNIGSSAFEGCTGLTSVTISSSVTSLGRFVFGECSGITSLTIPNSVTDIGFEAFYGCNLTSLTIPSSVITIGDKAFDCSNLTSLTIPSSVVFIGRANFYGSSSLTSIYVKGKTPPFVRWNSFVDVDKTKSILYVPVGSKSAYENAVVWRDFEHIVEVEFDTDITTLDNAIYVEQTEGRIGGTKDISVKMKNDFDVRGFQFTMELPEGTTINGWTLNQGRMPAGTTMNKVFATEGIDGNKINVVCALNDGEKTFTGNDGTIATVNVTFAEDMEEGTYPIYLTNNSISDATAQTQLVLSDIKSTLVLEDYVLGDTNGDGMVLVGDVISILNYIVGSPSNNFNAKAADVNGDGMILVGDVIAVLNIIVNQ